MRNNFFIKTICVLIGVIFLTLSVGRVSPVFAMAVQPIVPEIAPVFDTQIYQLRDYVESLPDPNVDIFYFISGALVASQAGTNKYKVADPFITSDGVVGWFKSCGIQLYNSVIGYTGGYNTTLGIDVEPILSILVANLMGSAVKAATYDSWQEFIDDINNSTNWFMPFNANIQQGINFLFAVDNGLYNWQFVENEWNSDFTFSTKDMSESAQTQYYGYLSTLTQPRYLLNSTERFNTFNVVAAGFDAFKMDLFIDIDDRLIYFYNPPASLTANLVWYRDVYDEAYLSTNRPFIFPHIDYSSYTFSTYVDLVNYFISPGAGYGFNPLMYTWGASDLGYCYPKISDFINNVYYGQTWDTRILLTNTSDLNFLDVEVPYYMALQSDYLLDIKGILSSLQNTTDIYDSIFNNIYDPYGDLVTDPLYRLINVALNIEEYLDQLNPPVPVDLNDIAEYTDNTYLEKVKEHARNFGDIFVNYIFFWHNCDSELVYVCFGAGILVLIAAFVGKWGHS